MRAEESGTSLCRERAVPVGFRPLQRRRTMRSFDYFQPTEIRFGPGRVRELPEVAARFGRRPLLVTGSGDTGLKPTYESVKAALEQAGLAVAHFDGVVPNPTTECVAAGAERARDHGADVVVGLGGGSSLDAAKAVAVEATHDGSCWGYLFFREAQPTEKTLPVVAVTTTSGTGSEVTQVAVVTHPAERSKSALYHPRLFPKVAIVDPELTRTMPRHTTAATGFDAFTHAFEAFLHRSGSPYTDVLALEAIRLVAGNLAAAVRDGADMEARSAMAWANVLGGLSIANAGVTLPHGMGMAIGGLYPQVAHGEALAMVYPECLRYTWRSAVAKFAAVARIFDADLSGADDEVAAERCCDRIDAFLKEIGLWSGLKAHGVPEAALPELAEACLVLPDHENHPRQATPAEVGGILERSYDRPAG
jgi:alcohol dehydrogenase